jgi:tRNA (guanine-N(7)-)-methyltransferase subunit TRM82
MPKRPCDIALTADKQIISADKFGDVYAVPILESGNYQFPETAQSEMDSKRLYIQANELTVHTQRNRIALENQLKVNPPQKPKRKGPAFEHTLLLGHVSMLTAVEVVSIGGRIYILTADRDEHIRVSRGMPQAHIIEGFCLGHAEFVSKLCVPTQRPEVLISGGGDDDLFVWDWRAGTLLSRAPLLRHVRDVFADVAKVAVSSLCCVPGVGGQTAVFATTERQGKQESIRFAS